MDFTIELKKGIGNLMFGMTVENVKQVLGEPTEMETIDNGMEEETLVLHYDDQNLTLFFGGETKLLDCIDTDNEETILFGQKIYTMDEKEIAQLMISNNYFAEDIETESWGERRVTFIEGNIDFFFEKDELMSVVFGK
jgi:UDP-2,3-diacylglucosamine pyrophosphatase LpxH